MTATLHVLRPTTPSIAGYLRIGHTGHRKLADLHAAGRLPHRRAVFDATRISHGVGQKESFRAADWWKPLSGGGGAASRMYVPVPDRYFKEDWLNAIFAAKGGRARLCRADTNCCPHGAEDMIENRHAHFVTQRHRQLDDLSGVPEDRRAGHFLLRHLDPAIRTARHATRLKILDAEVVTAVGQAKVQMVRLRDALADLDAKGTGETRSRAPNFRGGAEAVSAVLGR